MKVEVAVLGSPSLIILTVSVDVEYHRTRPVKAQELCESRGGRRSFFLFNVLRLGGRPGLPVPNNPYGFCGREVTLKKKKTHEKEADWSY